MIVCDSSKCQFEWFHFGYVQILNAPKGKWFCTDCRKRTISNLVMCATHEVFL